jgi:uncharacterized membrane protein
MKKLLSLLALFVVSLLTISMVSAADLSESVDIVKLKINGNTVGDEEFLYVEEGETLDIEMKLLGLDDGEVDNDRVVEDIELEVEIQGFEDDLEASTDMFDLEEGDTKWVDLSLTLPVGEEDNGDKLYLLRVKVTDKNNDELTMEWNLKVNPAENALRIVDVDFSPGTTVEAGHSLLTTVLVENVGEDTEEDVKVTVAIPELGVSAVDYIDEIDEDDKEHTGEDEEVLFFRIPRCAAAGEYTVTVTVKFNEGETVSEDFLITVVGNDKCKAEEQKLVITVGPETQNVVAGQQAIYPIALTNAGTTTKTYVLELTAGDWATATLSENLVVLEPGNTKIVYAYMTVSESAVAGEKVATLNIGAGDNVLKTLYLKANVVSQGKSFNLRNGLEVALVVLVAVLVIIGLVLGFSRLKKDELEEGEEKTYY